jgi:class 3 adenylate cyclase
VKQGYIQNIVFAVVKVNFRLIILLFFGVFSLSLPLFAGEAPEAPPSDSAGDPFYINLLDSPLYIRPGFDPEYINIDAAPPGEAWTVLPPAAGGRPRTARITSLDLPGTPERRFLSPRGAAEADFTFVMPFNLESGRAEISAAFIPALYLASLGDNWEIWINGALIRSEMHLDDRGRIKMHRAIRNISIPFDKSILKQGENIITIRLHGDPTYQDLGFFYGSPYYIGTYSRILRESSEAFSLALIGVYIFMGFYHLFIYLVMKNDRYNFFYGLFSLFLGLYFLSHSSTIFMLIPNQNIVTRIEFFTLYLVFPMGAAFLEHLTFKRSLLITKIYGGFFLLLGISQLCFSLPFALDTLRLWQCCAIAVAGVIIFYDIGYGLYVTGEELLRQFIVQGKVSTTFKLILRILFRTPLGNIAIGALLSLAAGVVDVVDSLFLNYELGITRYAFAFFTFGAALILARRVGSLYSQQQRIIIRANKGMNARLVDCIIVQDHDPSELLSFNTRGAVMFTDIRNFTRISEGMTSQTTTDFLSALNEALAKPIFNFQDRGFVAYTDKFMGDGTMNVFNDPDIALEAAVEMRRQLSLFNKNPQRYFNNAPPDFRVDVGTGIAYGPMTVGVMGHSRRVDYTHIGGTVNLASRLETLTKVYRVSILINAELYRAVDPHSFNLRLVDRIRAKGMNEPVEIYEEFSSNSPIIRDLKIDMAPQFRELQELYFSGERWTDALNLAEELLLLVDDAVRRNELGLDSPGDPIIRLYASRMRSILRTPELLSNWDGIYTFNEG